MTATSNKKPTAFELGESYARQGKEPASPYTDADNNRRFMNGYKSYQRRTTEALARR